MPPQDANPTPSFGGFGLRLTGQEVVDGVDTHRVEGKLQELEIAGARGDFEVVYWVGTDDGLLREVFSFGHLKLDEDTALIGNLDAETASIKLMARLSDHGRQVDVVTPTLVFPRFTHQAVLLNDGRVLVGGGFTGVANNNFIAPFPLGLVQLYDPETGMWSIVEPLQGPGVLYSAIELEDGRFLFTGLGGDDEGMASLFDPASGSWTSLPGLSSQRGLPNLVLLDDGRVLVAGGLDFSGSTSSYSPEIVNSVEIFDPTTGDWQQAAPMNKVSEDQWLFSLNDGRVMAMGALDDGSSDATAHAEIYDPAADTWTLVSSLEPYYAPTDAVQLSDGRLLVFGALSSYRSMSSQNGKTVHVELPDGRQLNAEQFAEQFPEAKIYDPATDAWTPAGRMALTRVDASLTLLPDGCVLMAGGEDPAGSEYVLYSTTEIFDPVTSAWSPGPDLSEPRSDHSATLMPDGRILLVGGIGVNLENQERYPLTSDELIDPAAVVVAPPTTPRALDPTPIPACEMTTTPTPAVTLNPATALPSPKAILDAANNATEAVDSYHLAMGLEAKGEAEGTDFVGSLRLTMDFHAPDRVRACLSGKDSFFGEIESRWINIGDVVYALDPQTGEWEIDESSETLVDALDFISDDVGEDLKELSVDGVEMLNDVSLYRISGLMPAAALNDTTLFRNLNLGGGGELQVVYWVGVSDSLVRRFTVEGALEPEEGVSPNPPKDTDGRREESGRGVRELQGK